MKKICVIGVTCFLGLAIAEGCTPLSQAIAEYQSSATVSPSFDLNKVYRIAVLPTEYTSMAVSYSNVLEVYYDESDDMGSDVRPDAVFIDGREVGGIDWVDNRFTTSNISPGSHSIKLAAFMGETIVEGRFNIGKSDRLVLRAKSTGITVDSRTKIEGPAETGDPASYLMDALNREGMKAGLSVIERSQVEAILDEQEFSYSGLVDPSTAAKLGKLMGAELVLISSASDSMDAEYQSWEVTITGRMVSVETGEILYACRSRGQGMDKNYASEQAAGNFFKKIRDAKAGQ